MQLNKDTSKLKRTGIDILITLAVVIGLAGMGYVVYGSITKNWDFGLAQQNDPNAIDPQLRQQNLDRYNDSIRGHVNMQKHQQKRQSNDKK